MAPTADDRRIPTRHGTALAIVMAIVVFYVLSIGPAYWLGERGVLSAEYFDTAYFPLIWLTDRSEAAHEVVSWYLDEFWSW